MLRSFLAIAVFMPLLAGCLGGMGMRELEMIPFGQIVDPAVRLGVLENGVSYFVRENDEPRNRAELRLVVNAGSILEDPDQLGLAHVVEHMAFNGTRSFEQHDIVDYFESLGMRFGPDVNAYTSFDETVYMLTLPTDSAGVLEKGIQILQEWASAITFDSIQVERERGVVIEEWRMGRGAGSRLQYRQFPTLAYRSRYADRLPIGTYESLSGFTHDALVRFYETWYRPDLIAVVAVGDFDVEEVVSLIQEVFGAIPPVEDAPVRREYAVPTHGETLISVATDRELASSTVALYVKERPRLWRSVSDYRRWLAETMATSMLVNRLSEYTQRVDSPFLDVSSYHGRFVRTLSTFGLSTRAPEDGAEKALHTLLLEVERAARHGFTRSELERERRELMRVMEQRYRERHRTTSSSFAADYVSYFLYGGTVLGSEREYELYRGVIGDIRLRDVDAVARDWTRESNRVILVTTPERPGVQPPRDDVLQTLTRLVPRQSLAPYRDLVSTTALVAERPAEGRIVAERELPESGILEWELENGSKLLMKTTDFREDEVLFAARSPGGTSLVDDDDYIPALTAAAVVQAGGLGGLTTNDLRKRLTGNVAGVGVDIGDLHEGLSGAASPRDLEILFQLIYLRFTAPRVDTVAFLAYQSQARASLANRAASPDVVFQDSVRVTLTQNHPRARPPSAEMFDELDLHRSFEFYQDRFADASDFTFYLVGNFDPEQIRPYVRRYLASLPSLDREEEGRDLGIRAPEGVVEKTVRKGVEPRAATQIVFTGPIEFERINVLAVQALADLLRTRLRDALREELGGTYNVDVRGAAVMNPVSRYQFSIAFGADPGRVAELTEVVFAELERLKESGPTEADVSRVRETQFRSRETNLRQNHFWLTQMLMYHEYGWDLEQLGRLSTRNDSVTAELIQNAARRYLDPANFVQVTLLPEDDDELADSR